MMLHLPNKLLLLLVFIMPSTAWSLSTDKDQPIEIEADHAQMDDVKGITQYKGNAVLTQGTLRIEGDIITFYLDKNRELIKVIAQGKLAKYQQIQKPGETPIKARALQLEYYAQTQMMHLLGKGHVWQNGNETRGARIEYDINKNTANASSEPAKIDGQPLKKERIHMIFQPPGKQQAAAKKPEAIIQQGVVPQELEGYPTAHTTSGLNVRTGPGTQYQKLGSLPKDSLVYILTEQKEWVQVRGVVQGKAVIGWVARSYISEKTKQN
jgi:lipopolysaccharide export system protein LptA